MRSLVPVSDLQQIRDWGAAAVVSLVEPAELGWLQVPHLGQEVERHGMKWLHIPIKDGGVPDDEAKYALAVARG